MSWGEPSAQPPYDPNNPYGQQQIPQQPQAPQGPQGPQSGWAQPSGAGYTQPMPDPSGYGPQQQYPYESQGSFPQQPGYPQQQPQPGYPAPEYAPYPPPPKKGNGALVASVVAAVLVVGGGITAAVMLTGKSNNPSPSANGSSQSSLVSPSANAGSPSAAASPSAAPDPGSSSSLTVPSSVSGLTLLTSSAATTAVTKMRTSLSSESQLYPDPVIGAYNDAGGNDVTTLFENQAIADLDPSAQSQLTDPSTVVSQLMSGAGISNAQSETTSADAGALSCGSRTVSGIDVVFCFWDDSTSFGGLEYYDSPSLSDAAATADAIRAASEGGS
jgi:hypothetical protein